MRRKISSGRHENRDRKTYISPSEKDCGFTPGIYPCTTWLVETSSKSACKAWRIPMVLSNKCILLWGCCCGQGHKCGQPLQSRSFGNAGHLLFYTTKGIRFPTDLATSAKSLLRWVCTERHHWFGSKSFRSKYKTSLIAVQIKSYSQG